MNKKEIIAEIAEKTGLAVQSRIVEIRFRSKRFRARFLLLNNEFPWN